MNRRAFLQSLFAAGAVAAAPKFIFDCGANLWRQKSLTEIMAEALEGRIEELNGGYLWRNRLYIAGDCSHQIICYSDATLLLSN